MKYLIYVKYSKDSDFEFLANIAKDKLEAENYIEEYSLLGTYPRMVPSSQIFTSCKDIDQQICSVLGELGINEESYSRTNNHFSVEVEGDWKHDHAHCDSILTKLFQCEILGEEITRDDGSDCYDSVHTYCLEREE